MPKITSRGDSKAPALGHLGLGTGLALAEGFHVQQQLLSYGKLQPRQALPLSSTSWTTTTAHSQGGSKVPKIIPPELKWPLVVGGSLEGSVLKISGLKDPCWISWDRLWAPRRGRRRRKELAVTLVTVVPQRGGCTLLWGVSYITHGLETTDLGTSFPQMLLSLFPQRLCDT